MRKLLTIFAFAVLMVWLASSCKKDHTCECTYKDVIGAPGTFVWEIEEAKKKDAEEACTNYTTAGWTEINCVLK